MTSKTIVQIYGSIETWALINTNWLTQVLHPALDYAAELLIAVLQKQRS
jgi:hypothetical protein